MPLTLADAGTGRRLRIASLDVERDAETWLSAIGLAPGEEVVVLRCAAFGGPLHVRTSSGGELAVGREVATKIHVTIQTEEGT
jgi:ferrous iron transport protein A